MRDPEPEPLREDASEFLTHKNDSNVGCFKPLNLLIICYAAIDN